MNPGPLLAAGPLVQVHAIAALLAVGLGAAQLLLPKGGRRHRTLGRIWALLLVLVALSSFGIHESRQFGPFSWIHGLSLFTLGALAAGILLARTGRITAHRTTMTALFFGGLVITGLFTLVPGRVMHAVLLGG